MSEYSRACHHLLRRGRQGKNEGGARLKKIDFVFQRKYERGGVTLHLYISYNFFLVTVAYKYI